MFDAISNYPPPTPEQATQEIFLYMRGLPIVKLQNNQLMGLIVEEVEKRRSNWESVGSLALWYVFTKQEFITAVLKRVDEQQVEEKEDEC